jgi:hypothetical protein
MNQASSKGMVWNNKCLLDQLNIKQKHTRWELVSTKDEWCKSPCDSLCRWHVHQ